MHNRVCKKQQRQLNKQDNESGKPCVACKVRLKEQTKVSVKALNRAPKDNSTATLNIEVH